jgi:hypothetical protein
MRNYRAGFVSWLFVLLCCLCSAAEAAPQVGWWWNPAESGRGFFVESQDGVTFIGAYGYDTDGHATWYVTGAPNQDSYNYTGPLYNKTHGETLFGAYAPPGDANIVGTLSAHFSDDTHGTITWPGGTVAIERQIFGGTNAPFQPFSGWWWNPDESGSGYSVELQGTKLFIVGFMYDDSGRPVWYYSAGSMSSDTTYSGAVLQFANGQTIGGPYHPPTTPTTVAMLDIAFSGMDEATFTFTEGSAAAASASFTKAGRSKTKSTQPQFPKKGTYVLPHQFRGSFSQDQKTHHFTLTETDDGTSNVLLDSVVWVSDSQNPNYVNSNGTMTTAADISYSIPFVTDCEASGVGSIPLPITSAKNTLSVDAYQKYHLHVEIPQLVDPIFLTGTCDGGGGAVTIADGNPLVKLDYSGSVVNDVIKGGGTKTETVDGVDVTTTYSFSFTANRTSP